MGQHYDQIGSDERNFIQRQLNLNRSQSWIAGGPGRPRSVIWRDIRHNRGALAEYDAAENHGRSMKATRFFSGL